MPIDDQWMHFRNAMALACGFAWANFWAIFLEPRAAALPAMIGWMVAFVYSARIVLERQ